MSEYIPERETQLNAEQVLQAGAELLAHFGVAANPHEHPEEFAAALNQLDPRYQGGHDLVRFELEKDETQWPEATRHIIMQAAEGMRMLEAETPLTGVYDVVVALGGARQSNLDRTRYAMQGASASSATFRHLVVAGSSRELPEAEQQNTANYAPGAATELDLCAAAARVVAQENPGTVVSIFGVDDKRASTPVVLESLFARLQANGVLGKGSRVAAVTTQIYQTSTELDLARMAQKFGITETATAGNPSDPNIVAKRTPSTYLSEILRTLRASVNAVQADKELAEAATRQEEARTSAEREYIRNHPELGLTLHSPGNYVGADGYTIYRFGDDGEPYRLSFDETMEFWK